MKINQGKYSAMVVCWILGLGSLVSWNSMLTIGDYYYNLFPVCNVTLNFCFMLMLEITVVVSFYFDATANKYLEREYSVNYLTLRTNNSTTISLESPD